MRRRCASPQHATVTVTVSLYRAGPAADEGHILGRKAPYRRSLATSPWTPAPMRNPRPRSRRFGTARPRSAPAPGDLLVAHAPTTESVTGWSCRCARPDEGQRIGPGADRRARAVRPVPVAQGSGAELYDLANPDAVAEVGKGVVDGGDVEAPGDHGLEV